MTDGGCGRRPVVRADDDGGGLLWADLAAVEDVRRLLAMAVEEWARAGKSLSPSTMALAAALSRQRLSDTPREGRLPSSSLAALLESGSLAGMAIEAAAAHLGISRAAVYRLRKAGRLRPAGRGRVLAVDVEREVRAHGERSA